MPKQVKSRKRDKEHDECCRIVVSTGGPDDDRWGSYKGLRPRTSRSGGGRTHCDPIHQRDDTRQTHRDTGAAGHII